MIAHPIVAPTTFQILSEKKKFQERFRSFLRIQLWKHEFTSTDNVVPKAKILKPKIGVSSKQKEMLNAMEKSEAITGIF